jgi:hypothetical protein
MPLLKKTGFAQPISGARFVTASKGVGSARKQAAAPAQITAHTHSMLSQASRNGRLTSIGSVQSMLTAHAGFVGPGNKGSRR